MPGVRENGGQYTHSAIWTVMAAAAMGHGERAWELFSLINPITHGATPAGVATYRVEPYVVPPTSTASHLTRAAVAGRGTPDRPAGCTASSSSRFSDCT